MKKITGVCILTALCIGNQFSCAADNGYAQTKGSSAVTVTTDKPAKEAENKNAGKALKELTDGNARYVAGETLHPHAQKADRKITAAEGQHPFATVLSCSDSRVPVEILFDQGIGDIFTIRNAGNVIDEDVMGSAEYGVEHLGTPLLVVMGHTKCGAVTAAATGAIVGGKIAAVIEKIKPAVETAKACYPDLKGDEKIQAAIVANTKQSAAQLLSGSAILAEAVESGKLKITGAIYDIESGKVNFFDLTQETAKPTKANKPGK